MPAGQFARSNHVVARDTAAWRDRLAAFSLSRAVVLLIAGDAVSWFAGAAPGVEQAVASVLALTNARLRSITGITTAPAMVIKPACRPAPPAR